jgi:hypothetical protein
VIPRLENPRGRFDAIDPGTTYYGVARFFDGALEWCAYSPTLSVPIVTRGTTLVIEGQRFRTGSRADPQTIIDLAFAAGTIRGQYYGTVVKIDDPQMWKGTIDGKIMIQRILKRLTPMETLIVTSSLKGVRKSNHEHVIDAIGIGLFMTGRLGQ